MLGNIVEQGSTRAMAAFHFELLDLPPEALALRSEVREFLREALRNPRLTASTFAAKLRRLHTGQGEVTP